MTGDRDEIARGTLRTLQETLNDYKSGIIIASVNISSLDYPQAVQAAVNDTQKATNDSARFRLEAETYRNDIVPRARGDAARIREDAEAYQERVTRDAEGQANRFVALLEEYEKAPRVTRDRLYIDAIEEVYGNSNKVLIDSQGSGNLLYLPIDKMIQGQQPRTSSQEIGGGREQNSFTPDDRTAESPERERRTRQ